MTIITSRVIIEWPNKSPKFEIHHIDGIHHRIDGPAVIRWNEHGIKINEEYWRNGLLHREGGPATLKWDKKGRILLEEYWNNGRRHNLNGPAIIRTWSNGKKCRNVFYINGKRMLSKWFSQLGKDIERDFPDEAIRNMIFNIYGVV